MAKSQGELELKPNPHAGLPLPAYAQAWENSVYRPPNIPAHHDHRLDPAHIFAFPQDPQTGEAEEYYVVGPRCSQCSRARQLCSRGDPICRRCLEKNLVCRPMGVGWEKCPMEKTMKPRLLQEMVALQRSLPDAPYYRDHSSEVSKTISAGANGPLKLRKGKQAGQDSASPKKRQRRSEGLVQTEEREGGMADGEGKQGVEEGKAGRRGYGGGDVELGGSTEGDRDQSTSTRAVGKLSASTDLASMTTTATDSKPNARADNVSDEARSASPSLLAILENERHNQYGEPLREPDDSPASSLQTMVRAFTARLADVIARTPSSSLFIESPTNGATPETTTSPSRPSPSRPSPSKERLPMARLSPPLTPTSIMVTSSERPYVSTSPFRGTSTSPVRENAHSLATSDRLASRMLYEAPKPSANSTQMNIVSSASSMAASIQPAEATISPPNGRTSTLQTTDVNEIPPTPTSSDGANPPTHATPSTIHPASNATASQETAHVITPVKPSWPADSSSNTVPSSAVAAVSQSLVASRVKTFSIPIAPSPTKSSSTPRLSIRVPPRPNIASGNSSQGSGSHGAAQSASATGKPTSRARAGSSASAVATSQSASLPSNGSPAKAKKPHTPSASPMAKLIGPVAHSPETSSTKPDTILSASAAAPPASSPPPDASSAPSCSFRLSTSAAWTRPPNMSSHSDADSSDDERPLMDIHRERLGKRKRTDDDMSEASQRRKREPWKYAPSTSLLASTSASAPQGSSSVLPPGSRRSSEHEDETFISSLRKEYNVSRVASESRANSRVQSRHASDHDVDADDDEDSEEEVLQVLKRPRRPETRKTLATRLVPEEPAAPTFLPRQRMLDDSTVVMIEDYLFHLPKSRLIYNSDYFANTLAQGKGGEDRSASDDEGLRRLDRCQVIKAAGVSPEDFEALLSVCDNMGAFIENTPPFRTLAGVFCAARTLRFNQIDALATYKLSSMWPSEIHKLSPVRAPYAAETVVLARMYNVPSVLKRAFYELLRTDAFGQQTIAAEPDVHDTALRDGSRLVGHAKLSHADLIRLVHTREKLQLAWMLLVGNAPSSTQYPCMLQHTTGSSTSYSTHAMRARCAEAHARAAAIWADKILDSGFYETWAHDPVCGLERLVILNWEDAGYCSSCVMTRRQLWTRKREEIWENLDTWLGL